eukprot:2379424-Alexandrium_andersonii.AAC.1
MRSVLNGNISMSLTYTAMRCCAGKTYPDSLCERTAAAAEVRVLPWTGWLLRGRPGSVGGRAPTEDPD